MIDGRRVILVTGSTKNLGLQVAKAFLQSGEAVIVHGPSEPSAARARDELAHQVDAKDRLHMIACDLADQAAIDDAFKNLRHSGWAPDVLINNAAALGIGVSGFLDQDPKFLRHVVDVNVLGAFRCAQLAARSMVDRGIAGKIINISSLAGSRPIWGRSAYSASKAAVDSLTRSMALELAEFGITVNAVIPGYVLSERWADADQETIAACRNDIPVGELTDPVEIAHLIIFLCGDQLPSLTGSGIVIDGGLAAQQLPSSGKGVSLAMSKGPV